MSWIASNLASLDGLSEKYSVEALADALKPAWVEEALRDSCREGQRSRRLPADFTLWAVVLLRGAQATLRNSLAFFPSLSQ